MLDAQFSPEELKVMLDEAAGARRAVATHCHAKEGIMNALNTGVKTIEHGSYLGEECVPLMKQKDVFVVTASVIEGGHEIRGRAARRENSAKLLSTAGRYTNLLSRAASRSLLARIKLRV